MNDREKHIVAHHEGGHALLAEVLPTTDRVHKVSIIPRGTGALGYTMQLPIEDRYIVQRAELYDKITVLFGGRAPSRSCSARSPPAPPTISSAPPSSAARMTCSTA
jgi:cell division protease FtsH